MKLNLKDPNPGIWFPWPWNKKKTAAGGGVTLRGLTLRKRREIDVETVTAETKYIGGEVYNDRTIDEEKRARMVNDYCIVDWTGLTDQDGNEIPCTTEMKELIFLDFPELAGFLALSVKQADAIMIKRMGEAEKN